MNLHLVEIAQAVAPGAHAVMLVDQAGWHVTAALIIPQNISIIPLPPKCPERNPVTATRPASMAIGPASGDLHPLAGRWNSRLPKMLFCPARRNQHHQQELLKCPSHPPAGP
jgi:hypothetical protein